MRLNRTVLLSAAPLALVAALTTTASAVDLDQDVIIVTASPIERPVQETIIGVSIIDEDELERRLENSIGEVLRREPGVSSSFFGPGASRPIIRGLGANRVRVLDAGIGSIDVSATSPDHAVAVEPATAERIEIVRGTSILRYGSSAAGGVVNVISGRIPSELPEDGIDGALRIGGETVNNSVEAAGGFDVLLGKIGNAGVVFHGDGYYRDAEDYDIPGFAESARLRALEEAEEEEGEEHEEEEEVFGVAENSFYETTGGSAGLSFVFDNGFFGISGTAIDSQYGLPGGHGHEEEEGEEEEGEEEEEGGVQLDVEQRRLDLNGEIEGDFAIFQKAVVRVGYADYEHIEFEPNGEAGTVFSNEGWEGRLELVDKEMNFLNGSLNGAIGFQFILREFSAIGEEAFVPPTDSEQFGIFAVKEYTTGPWRFELGGRYENSNLEVVETGFERSFDSFSVSGGAGFKASENVFLGLTAFRTERAPATEELFSNGPHLATDAFEIGDPNLNEETAIGIEGSIRFSSDRFEAAINGFYTSYDDFIYEIETGDIEDGLPVFQFVANDATFVGFEAQGEAQLFSLANFDISADASVDYVRATADVSGNDNLPRIPPLSGLLGLEARSACLDFRAELEYAADQDDVTTFELPTDGYEVFNAFVTFRPFPEQTGLSMQLAGKNLTNEEVRLHTSFIKDLAPLPGRSLRVSLRGTF